MTCSSQLATSLSDHAVFPEGEKGESKKAKYSGKPHRVTSPPEYSAAKETEIPSKSKPGSGWTAWMNHGIRASVSFTNQPAQAANRPWCTGYFPGRGREASHQFPPHTCWVTSDFSFLDRKMNSDSSSTSSCYSLSF